MRSKKRKSDTSNALSEVKISKGKRFRLSHPGFIMVLSIISCLGVGFSSWNVGNTSNSFNVDASVAEFDDLFLEDVVIIESVTGFTVGKTGVDSPSYGIYENGVVVYEADILVSYSFTVNFADSNEKGLYYYFDTTDTGGVLSEMSLTLSLIFESGSFDMSGYVESVGSSSLGYYVGSKNVSNQSSLAAFGSEIAKNSTLNKASSTLTLMAAEGYGFESISTISLTVAFHINFTDFSVIENNYDAIAAATVVAEVSTT